jgi:hypothetical protein
MADEKKSDQTGSVTMAQLVDLLKKHLPPDQAEIFGLLGDSEIVLPPEAARDLADMIEERGIVGPIEDAKAPLRDFAKHQLQKRALETGQVDLRVANEWIAVRWPAPRPFPLCDHEEWGIGPSLAQIPTSALGLHSPPRTNPCVAVVCGHCGNTVFLNALVMGLLPKSEG